ncbi:MAG: N-acetyl-gamma-glutamyl-phosphate reductase, partial [Epsilonproteobacteria bacterium]|nr:N-acetyl-gamma-glutamyl-phosphate reductase [Campylobacterota bacterium]
MSNKIKVAVVGASGYTGLELLKILINHPLFTITYVANSEGDTTVSKLHPSLKGVFDMEVKKANPDDIKAASELVFLALP